MKGLSDKHISDPLLKCVLLYKFPVNLEEKIATAFHFIKNLQTYIYVYSCHLRLCK